MAINHDLKNEILEHLEPHFGVAEISERKLVKHFNVEIFSTLLYLEQQGYVKGRKREAIGTTPEYYGVNITAHGLDYLANLNR